MSEKKAKLLFKHNSFEIIEEGDYVLCAVSGKKIKLQDLNYWNNEPEESTGSISGSVVRAGDVNLFNKPGNFFFHSDYNALGFTYVSASIYSQSIDFVTCQYASGGLYTSSQGFITQSHYCYHNVIQYITGSYT